MSRLPAIKPEEATGKAKELLDAIQKRFGTVINMFKGMANSPAVLQGYVSLSDSLDEGALDAKLRQQIALLSAETNGCGYCASAHTVMGKAAGLNQDEILAARGGSSSNEKSAAALKFANTILEMRGAVGDADVQAVRDAGFSDGEISEIIAHVALNIFTNYFNTISEASIDFPKIDFPLKRAASV